MIRYFIIFLLFFQACSQDQQVEVIVQPKGFSVIKFNKSYNKWFLNNNLDLPVNQQLLEYLYTNLKNLIDNSEVVQIKPELAGVNDPNYIITFGQKQIKIGKANRYLQKFYFQYLDQIYLADPAILTLIGNTEIYFLQRKLLELSEINQISIKDSQYFNQFSKTKDHWISKDLDFTVDSIELDQFVDLINKYESDQLILNKNCRVISRLELSDLKTKQVFDLCEINESKFLCNNHICYKVDLIKLKLSQGLKLLGRKKKIFNFDPKNLKEIQFKGQHNYVLKKTLSTWLVDEQPSDLPFVEQLIKQLVQLEAEDSSKLSSLKEFANLTLIGVADKIDVKIGNCHGNLSGICIKTSEFPEVFKISEKSFRMLYPEQKTLLNLG